METVFDWMSLAIFAGLAVLFLQRSMDATVRDRMIDYFPPAIGCAIGNYLGNKGYPIPSVLILAGSVAYIFYFLKPFSKID